MEAWVWTGSRRSPGMPIPNAKWRTIVGGIDRNEVGPPLSTPTRYPRCYRTNRMCRVRCRLSADGPVKSPLGPGSGCDITMAASGKCVDSNRFVAKRRPPTPASVPGDVALVIGAVNPPIRVWGISR